MTVLESRIARAIKRGIRSLKSANAIDKDVVSVPGGSAEQINGIPPPVPLA